MTNQLESKEISQQITELCDTVQEAFLYLEPYVEQGTGQEVLKMIVEISHAIFSLDNGQRNLKLADNEPKFMWAFNEFYQSFLQFAKDAEESEVEAVKNSYLKARQNYEAVRVILLDLLNKVEDIKSN